MPVRGETTRIRRAERYEYSYDEVVELLREKIEERFGGIAKFLESDAYKKTKLGESKKDKQKIYTYLSAPTAKTKRVKSFPVIKKLFDSLFQNIEMTEERKTIIQHKIFTSTKI